MLLVSKKTISNWENGRTIPDTENLIQFANTIISFCNFFKFSFHLNSVRILLF
ncbi:helix-turn-helix transcriptional regulator [Enterococcus faecium]|nr:helix-turn-helix transcriptional regulator [Enterococcus faecium]